MSQVTHKGNTLQLSGEVPLNGTIAPDFTITLADLSDKKLSNINAKAKVLLCMPSLDTSTCALETRTFNKHLANLGGVEALIITKDLPFAMKRFCATEGIENAHPASDFRYSSFAKAYGVEITEGALKGLHARAVWVLDSNNKIVHTELVSDVSSEPDYDAAINAVKSLL